MAESTPSRENPPSEDEVGSPDSGLSPSIEVDHEGICREIMKRPQGMWRETPSPPLLAPQQEISGEFGDPVEADRNILMSAPNAEIVHNTEWSWYNVPPDWPDSRDRYQGPTFPMPQRGWVDYGVMDEKWNFWTSVRDLMVLADGTSGEALMREDIRKWL